MKTTVKTTVGGKARRKSSAEITGVEGKKGAVVFGRKRKSRPGFIKGRNRRGARFFMSRK